MQSSRRAGSSKSSCKRSGSRCYEPNSMKATASATRRKNLPTTVPAHSRDRMVGGVKAVEQRNTFRSTISSSASQSGDDSEENLITLCDGCHKLAHHNRKLDRCW